MSKNNNKNSQVITAIAISAVVLALGYFLVRSAPGNLSQSALDGGSPGAPLSGQLNSLIGNPMPAIQLADKDGKTFTLPDFKGKYTVLFFSEGLMCYPACWNQIASFGDDLRFNSDQVQAISVVTDTAKDWQRAVDQMPRLAKATMMFDAGGNTSGQLGMLTTNSSMHRGALPGHTYVLIDKDGIVKYVFDDPNMAIANDMLFNKIQEINK